MRLVAGEALTRFTVSAPHNDGCQFFTGEARDAAMDYHFANGKVGGGFLLPTYFPSRRRPARKS